MGLRMLWSSLHGGLCMQGSHPPRPSNRPTAPTPTEFCCNGTVVDDPELGQVIQLQVGGARLWLCGPRGLGLQAHSRSLWSAAAPSPPLQHSPQPPFAPLRAPLRHAHPSQTLTNPNPANTHQGDQRKNVVDFLTNEGLVKKDLIKIHGF